MSPENQLPAAPHDLAQVLAHSQSHLAERLKLEDGLAKARGIGINGDCLPGKEAENRAKYGASSPKHRYCYEPRGITIEDLASDWGLDVATVRTWVIAENWDQIRADHLETVPLFLGGRKATGDLAAIKDEYIRGMVTDGLEIQRICMDRLRARKEQTVDKATVLTLDKTSKEHLNDVLAYKEADVMIRTALQLPTKYSASMTQTTTEKRKVTASVVQAPQRGGAPRAALEPSSTITTTVTETVEAG